MNIPTIRSRLRSIRNVADSLDGILGDLEEIAFITTEEHDRVIATLDRIARLLGGLADRLGSFVDPQVLKPTEELASGLGDDDLSTLSKTGTGSGLTADFQSYYLGSCRWVHANQWM
jgi:hypothetical protein